MAVVPVPSVPLFGKKVAWPKSRLTLIQIGLAAVIATLISEIFGNSVPFFAPLTAVTLIQVLCSPHRRGLWLFLFGEVNGMLIGTLFNPAWSTRAAAFDALVGAAVAIGVTTLTSPRSPVRLVNEAVEPVLTRLSTNVRTIAVALRSGDTPAAGAAVYNLNAIETDLAHLNEVLHQVRRSSVLARWWNGKNLNEYTHMATELGYAARDIRTLARHAWWGVLRPGEQVPAALPQMLDSLADGLAVLRDEIAKDGQPHEARPILVSAGRWVDVMREQPLTISAATVAASADAAVLDLLVATGVPVHDAEQLLRRATPAAAIR